MNLAVTEYIEKVKVDWQADACKRLREIIHVAVPDVEERLQYGKPHFMKKGKYACVIGTAKGWVSFTIFNAQSLKAPEGFFEPSEVTERQTFKVLPGKVVDYDLLASLVKQAADTI